MLRKFSSRDDDLGSTDVVVGQEDNLQEVTNVVVVVNLVRDGSDELDESLGVVVAGSGLTTDHDDTRLELAGALMLRSVQNRKISVDNVQDVHELALVFVNTLDLDVIERIDRDIEAGVLLDPSGKLFLVLTLDFDESFLEVAISGIGHKLLEVLKRSDPFVNTTEGVGEQLRQGRVAAVNPTTRRDTVGLVLELARIELIELAEDSGSQQVSVKLGDTVDGMRAYNGEVSHADLLGVALLNETHALNLLLVTGVLLSQLLQVNVVNEIDELEMTRKKTANQVDGPLLKGLRKHSMVGIRERVVDDAPGLLKAEHLLIDENTQKLNSGNGRMGIVQLHAVLLGEHSKSVVVLLLISADHVIDGSRAEEVLLLETELLTGISAIVGVEHGRDVLGLLSLGDGTLVVRRVESIEVEVRARARSPQTQVVGIVGVEAGDRSIVSHGKDLLAALPLGSLSVAILVLLRVTVETNLVGDILALNFPRVAVVQPEVRNLYLITILDLLLENTVVISNTITPSRDLKGGERVDEASGKSTETTITKGGISLLLIELLEVITHVHESLLELLLHVNVDEGILESTTHKELERQIVNSLDILVLMEGLRVVP